MGFPAAIRVNTQLPFPAQVTGSGVVAISKQNGIWNVSLNFTGLAQLQVVPDPANTYALVWDPLTNAFSLLQVGAFSGPGSKVTKTLTGAQSPYTAIPTDDVLLVNAVPFTVNVDWSMRGKPLRVVDITGNASVANPITITPAAGQTQLAQVNFSYLIDGAGGSITLTPLPSNTGAY